MPDLSFNVIDNLTYTYGDAARPDRLTNVSDAGNAAKGFKFASGAAAYTYDLNGNLTQDNHKGLSLGYNYLNLPNYYSNTGGADVSLTYTADGEKLTKVSSAGTRNYITGIEYLGTALDAIYHADGRCTPNGASAFYYEYTIKDHLGNARVNFRANGTAVTFLQELHYYPFGMVMEGIGTAKITDNGYKYNGKELNEDLGLNLSDYGARWYDANLGRWWSVDPMGEKFKGWSPFNYTLNNPIRLTDPNGMEPGDPIGPGYYAATVNSRIISFSVRHPIAAISIGTPVKGSTNLSTNAVRFSTRINLQENDAHEGSQVNAYRHTLWQATITTEFGARIAQEVGNAHEENPFAATGNNLTNTFSTSADADETADLLNNVIGRSIGEANPNAGMQELALKTLDYFKENGLWTSSSVANDEGKLVGFRISQENLSQRQYDAANETIKGLNNQGFTPGEQSARDAGQKQMEEQRKWHLPVNKF